MSVRLLLVRHGRSVSNLAGQLTGWRDAPLSADGVLQAERVAAHLVATVPLVAVYTSSLQRARHTADAIARLARLTPVVDDDLREFHFGDCEGLTHDQVRERFPEAWRRSLVEDDPTFHWPGGETRAQLYARIRRAFSRIVAGHPGAAVAVVSHGGVLSTYLSDVLDGQPWPWLRYRVRNCSVTEVELSDGGARLVRFDDTSFLDGLTTSFAP